MICNDRGRLGVPAHASPAGPNTWKNAADDRLDA
jgi:hypothetical protein